MESVNLTKTEEQVRKTRDLGLEILRIISIFLITCVHMLNYGGFLANATGKVEIGLLRLLYSFFTVSVNVFVLISGYFLVKSKFKISKIVKLWLMVVFYMISLYFVSVVFKKNDFSLKTIIKCFMPLLNNNYWFFSAYFVLFLIYPLLNKIINNLSKKESIIVLIGIFLFSYISIRFPLDKVMGSGAGYSVIWFICLYFIGGIIRNTNINFKGYIWIGLFFVGIFFIFANYYIPTSIFGYKYFYNSPDYTAPAVVFSSVCIFMFFKQIKSKNQILNKSVAKISSTTFGIYLLQENVFVKPYIYFNILKVQNYYAQNTSILYIFLFVSIIFVCGALFDFIRQIIFYYGEKIIAKIKKRLKNKN